MWLAIIVLLVLHNINQFHDIQRHFPFQRYISFTYLVQHVDLEIASFQCTFFNN